MKRILIGLLLGALIFGVAFAGAKIANVTNPMTANLDGGTYAISNLSALTADTVAANVGLYAGAFTPGGAHGTIQLSDGTGNGPGIYAGTSDPTLTPCPSLQPGSLYLRRVSAAAGEWWAKITGDPCGWVKVAG